MILSIFFIVNIFISSITNSASGSEFYLPSMDDDHSGLSLEARRKIQVLTSDILHTIKMKIAVVGLWHLGTITALSLSKLNNLVYAGVKNTRETTIDGDSPIIIRRTAPTVAVPVDGATSDLQVLDE